MGARRVGGNFALFFPFSAGVSHDSPRAQPCTFERPGLQKHHHKRMKFPAEREKKRAKFCVVRGRAV